MTYNEALDYIHSVGWLGSRPGLSRTVELLRRLGNPEQELKFVHVAGTNGKGSTCACIASVLKEAGYKVGFNLSPYILRFNERIQICGEQISDEDLAALVEEVRVHAEAMEDHPTEFELITALALLYFKRQNCDIVVLEVGLGGELDSTNVIPCPEVAVLTAMGMDHTQVLGDTMAQVARAKAGIIKDGGMVVSYGGNAEADEVFRAVCKDRDARFIEADHSRVTARSFDLGDNVFSCAPYGELHLPLIGRYQLKNACVAITALEALREKGWKISDEDIRRGLAAVRWPGRFELLSQEPIFLLDGAHNPHGMAATVESLRAYFPEGNIHFLLGVMADKDVAAMTELLAPLAADFTAVRPDNDRAMSAEALGAALAALERPVTVAESVAEGVRIVREKTGERGVACALGSLYFSGDVRQAVLAEKS
ncbi:MAG: bifunctional folylpolyglutamate synthase/dihydrofolate synthase [Oscillospiraceae bacterium]|nr:bifunctional folylpolyglutamate synthase/dihydrofolate synthase [Oscillospiraceae bacterium]